MKDGQRCSSAREVGWGHARLAAASSVGDQLAAAGYDPQPAREQLEQLAFALEKIVIIHSFIHS
jgi:hypothetical protein